MGAASFVKINEEARQSLEDQEPPVPSDPMPETSVVRVLVPGALNPELGELAAGDEIEMVFTQAETCARLGYVEILQGREGNLFDVDKEALAQEALALGVLDPDKGKPAPISVLRKWGVERLQKAISDKRAEAK